MSEPVRTFQIVDPDAHLALEQRVRDLEDELRELRRAAIVEPTLTVRDASPVLGLSIDQIRRRIAGHREELLALGAILERPQRVHIRRWRDWERRRSR